jgi:hypothetical protein
MKGILLLALLCALTLQQTVLLSSCPENTLIINPPDTYPVVEAYHTTQNPDYISYGAKWIYKNGSDSWPAGDRATFFTEFYADCTKDAVLVITADNSFTACVNKGDKFTGDNW